MFTVYFKTLSQHFHAGTEGQHKTPVEISGLRAKNLTLHYRGSSVSFKKKKLKSDRSSPFSWQELGRCLICPVCFKVWQVSICGSQHLCDAGRCYSIWTRSDHLAKKISRIQI